MEHDDLANREGNTRKGQHTGETNQAGLTTRKEGKRTRQTQSKTGNNTQETRKDDTRSKHKN